MFNRFNNVFLLTGILFIVATANAAAGSRPYAFTLTPQVGLAVFEGNRGLDPVYSGGLSLGYNFSENWGAEGVVTYGKGEASEGSEKVDVMTLRLDALYHFRPQKSLVPYLAFSLGGIDFSAQGNNDEDGLIGYGVGMKYFLPEGVAIRLDLRHLFDVTLRNVNAPRSYYNIFQASAGVCFQFGGEKQAQLATDSDGDGIVDAYDRCPGSKLGARVDGSGCVLDADGDGVDDRKDLCLGTPVGTRVDASGCSETTPEADADGDGVVDGLDRCPETPAGTLVDASGCPGGMMDGDGDGVGDDHDRCPNTPGFVPVNSYGCPSDTDGDGVFDADDQCPDSSPGVEVGPEGCEILAGGMTAAPVTEILGDAIVIRLELRPGEYQVPIKYDAALAKAAAFIAQHPDTRFVVAGHTDSVGPAEFNLELSRKRAESVRTYLIQRFGIAPERLEVRGFGESQPLGDNSTQEGRFRNRRVVVLPAIAP